MPQGPTVLLGSGRGPAEELPRTFGSLSLLKSLSRNDLGETYLAVRPEGVERLCVVNLLAPAVVAAAEVVDALRAEASWLVSRVHGHLVQIYDVGQVAERLFFVSEWVEGADLARVLAAATVAGRDLPVASALSIALEFADAVEFIGGHETRATGVATSFAGLTASSVIISRDGHVKLLHHGSCLVPSSETVDAVRGSRTVVATASGGAGGQRDEVYCVGSLLWEMLTLRPLAEEMGSRSRDKSGVTRYLPRTPSLATGKVFPPALDDLVVKSLDPDPEQRPASIAALRTELVALLKADGSDGAAVLGQLVTDVFGVELTSLAAEVGLLARSGEALLAASMEKARPVTLTDFDRQPARALASVTDLKLGEVIPGTRYRALEKLGEGGMGAVYAAEHVDIEKKVALKLLHGELVANPVVFRQFRQEARAASRIGNPYICDVTDWGEVSDGRVFFVMEFLDGPPVAKVLRQKRRLPPGRTLPILRQVAKALGAAHQKGIVHLDVKPDNVMLLDRHGRNDTVKVVDFGVAGLIGQGAGANKIMGTPEYMAPERVLGRGYDHRSDIYSLGAMAYEMLVGEVPFQGAGAVETMALQATELPDAIRERSTTPVHPAIEAVVMRMLAKDPADRPQTMTEVEALLCEAQIDSRLFTPWDDLPLPAIDPERAERIARRLSIASRRSRMWLSTSLMVAGAAVVVALFFAFRSPSTSDGPRTAAPVVMIDENKLVAAAPNASATPSIGGITVEQLPAAAGARPAPAIEPTRAAIERPARRRRENGDDGTARRDDGAGLQASARGVRAPAGTKDLVIRGRRALADGDLAQARKEFSLVLDQDPTNADAVGGLAEVSFEYARYEEALDFAKQAVRLAPRGTRHVMFLGHTYFKLGKYQDAKATYERAAVLAPSDELIKSSLARVNAKLQQ